MHAFIALLACVAAAPTTALTGYDCGGDSLNITSLSLTEIKDCEIDGTEPKTTETHLQLLQWNEYDHVQATQCRIEIDRQIFHCGMHSHISAVSSGKHRYLHDLTREPCMRIHDAGALVLENNVEIANIKVNTTTTRSVTLAGSVRNNGKCTGTTYSDVYGTWDDVFVQASITITIRSFQISIHTPVKEVIFPSGTRCRATDESCSDDMGTPTFWKMPPTDSCGFNRYDVLYEGPAHKMVPSAGQDNELTVYTVTTKGTTFALTKTKETNLCGYTLIHTEHPKLFILDTPRGRTFKTMTAVHPDNLDIFTYVNSKFVFVEKHLKTQLSQLYRDVMTQKCALEKQILENALSLASIAPDEMAYRIMKSAGYTAFVAGEIIYIVRCVPVDCKVRHTDMCYNELPVSHKNKSYFITPRSRILIKTGTVRDCNELLPAMYRIQGTWFRMSPRPMESLPPPVIRPLTSPTWKYISPANLATSGIYSTDDIERLKNHLIFSVEKSSIINNLAQGAMGGTIPAGTIALHNLLDEESLQRIAESTGRRLWNGFVTFGSASAGVITILMILHLIKLVLNSIIRGYALHSVYGWSLHVLGAVWSTVANILLHKGHAKKTQSISEEREEEETPLEVAAAPGNASVLKSESDEKGSESGPILYSIPRRIPDYGELNKYLHDTRGGQDTVC